jgi:hypothetical protein
MGSDRAVFVPLRVHRGGAPPVRPPPSCQPFANLAPISELNSPATDWDPWISEDGRDIVFGSDRDGTHEIYKATR